jgi:hypothetical protein
LCTNDLGDGGVSFFGNRSDPIRSRTFGRVDTVATEVDVDAFRVRNFDGSGTDTVVAGRCSFVVGVIVTGAALMP